MRRQNAAVLFADVRGFTVMSEGMDVKSVAEFLKGYRARLTEPILTHGGTVDKFIGDAIMAVFGAPQETAHNARNALRCAGHMIREIAAWNVDRCSRALPAIQIGIEVHFGRSWPDRSATTVASSTP